MEKSYGSAPHRRQQCPAWPRTLCRKITSCSLEDLHSQIQLFCLPPEPRKTKSMSQTPPSEMLARLGFSSDKDRLVKACQNLYELVYIYVSATNTIFKILNQHLGTNFPILAVKENFSIKENLQLLISALKDMQATMETKDKDVQESMKLRLYARISGPILSLQEKMAAVKEIYENYKGIIGGILGALVAVLLKLDNFPGSFESAMEQLLSSPALSLHVSELLMDYADIIKMLQQNGTPTTTRGRSSAGETSQQLRLRSVSSDSSLFAFIQTLLQGHRSIKKSLKVAADCLEEAFRVLRPPCEAFQIFVKMIEGCIPAIAEKLQET